MFLTICRRGQQYTTGRVVRMIMYHGAGSTDNHVPRGGQYG